MLNFYDMAASPSHPSISADNCGYCSTIPCAVLDLDEDTNVENNWNEDDYNLIQSGSGSYAPPSGPKCPTCPLTCDGDNCP